MDNNQILQSEDIKFAMESPANFAEMENTVANPPSFPLIIVIFALIKDLVDLASFGFLGWITSPILGAIIFFWFLGKRSFIRRLLWRRFIKKRAFVTAILEIVPFVSMVPWTTFFVIKAHYKETKIIQELDLLVDAIRGHRIPDFNRMMEIAYA